jgi:uncharacterized membrane protein YhfC
MLYVTYALNALLMIALPIGLGIFLAERLGQKWRLFLIGALTFIASQVVHIPVNIGLTALFAQGMLPQPPEAWHLWFNPVVLGLTAGLSEELARYAVYRWWIRDARTWAQALMFGAGHGGIEAILVGLSVAATYVAFIVLQTPGGLSQVPPEQQPLVAEQLAAYWSQPWPMTLLGAVERVWALCLHLSCAVMVLQVFRRGSLLWLVAAILWHAASNAVALITLTLAGPYWSEAVLGLVALVSLGIIFGLRDKEERESGEMREMTANPVAQ